VGAEVIWAYKTLLHAVLSGGIRLGCLTVTWPDQSTTTYGNDTGPRCGVALRDAKTIRRIMANPELGIGEAYMEGGLVLVAGSIHDLLTLLTENLAGPAAASPVLRLNDLWRRLRKPFDYGNNFKKSRRNVAHHYDLNGALYALFLDRDRQYSCAYFATGEETLEEAQAAKKRHIAAKLRLDRPGLRVLDIGCGWGGMALTLARDFGAHVTGITLSVEQLREARARAAAAGLGDRVNFELMDYRAVEQSFDRIVSVGMFEHVGTANYPDYFAMIRRCLRPDGVALVHSIGRFGTPSITNEWIAKYIFPGGYSPSLSEVLPVVEESGLLTTDIEILRLHYARTIAHWRRRFAANRAAIAALYDERFCRMFEFYLSGSELAFVLNGHMNFQIQLTPSLEAVPLTRDYMFEAEREQVFARAAE